MLDLEAHQFICQYVLNRALCQDGPLDGVLAATEGKRAWDYITKVCLPEEVKGGEKFGPGY